MGDFFLLSPRDASFSGEAELSSVCASLLGLRAWTLSYERLNIAASLLEGSRSYWPGAPAAAGISGKRTRRVNESSKEQCRLQRDEGRSGLALHGAGGREDELRNGAGMAFWWDEEKSEQQTVMLGG